MGLKSKDTSPVWPGTSLLKSDQNGIEIKWNDMVIFRRFLLKSDQNGIEIGFRRWNGGYNDPVKIRPKWD